jgi:hypothetical protein
MLAYKMLPLLLVSREPVRASGPGSLFTHTVSTTRPCDMI